MLWLVVLIFFPLRLSVSLSFSVSASLFFLSCSVHFLSLWPFFVEGLTEGRLLTSSGAYVVFVCLERVSRVEVGAPCCLVASKGGAGLGSSEKRAAGRSAAAGLVSLVRRKMRPQGERVQRQATTPHPTLPPPLRPPLRQAHAPPAVPSPPRLPQNNTARPADAKLRYQDNEL
ncbi:hypothetical protein E2C01_048550 [Portunus trituberculatus]|uniref:Uncharacterized protein n=1 Tax=Portunus trituberculatus TaxID=210409 RepID=A0A5B7GB90_PORTR|nr:hypothetical protein [Portunus trituberculatus]